MNVAIIITSYDDRRFPYIHYHLRQQYHYRTFTPHGHRILWRGNIIFLRERIWIVRTVIDGLSSVFPDLFIFFKHNPIIRIFEFPDYNNNIKPMLVSTAARYC